MSLRILCIGDQHFKPSNIPQVDIFLQKLEKWLSENEVDLIVSMGDLLHTHERLHTQALNKALQYIHILRKHAKTYILIGNHDGINNQIFLNENHWLNSVKELSDVVVVDTVHIVEKKNHKLTLCPYVPDGKFRIALDTKKGEWEDSSVIFAHQLFDGAKMGAILAENVEKWDEKDPMVVCAHVHDSQWVQDNLYIVGSAMQDAFGESENKTLLLLSLPSSGTSTGRRMTKEDFSFIDLGLPKKKIIYLEMEELEKFDPSTLQLDTEYKLSVDGSAEEFDAYKKTVKYKELSKRVRIVFKHKRIVLTEKREKWDEKKLSSQKRFDKLLEELVTEENNPYLSNLFNTLVLHRSGEEKEEMLFL